MDTLDNTFNFTYEKIDKLLNVYQHEMLAYIFETPSQSQRQKFLRIAQVFSLHKFMFGLDTYIPTVSDVEEKEELMVFNQQIKVIYSVSSMQLLMLMEFFYQRFFWLDIHFEPIPLKIQAILPLGQKTWVMGFEDLQSNISLESYTVNKLNNVLKQWQQQADKTAQDELAIQQLSSELVKVDEHRNKYHRYKYDNTVQLMSKAFYEYKYETFEKPGLEVDSHCLVPYTFQFPFSPNLQPPIHLTIVGEEIKKNKKIPACPSDKNYALAVELVAAFLDQCISQLIDKLEDPEHQNDKEVIKIHIEELRYSQGAKYKFITYIKFYHIGLFKILTVYKS